MAETHSTFSLKPGDQAPDFTLPDGKGSESKLSELKGKQGTLVFFACNHCPFVVHLAEAIASVAAKLKSDGIATVAISSNDVANYPQDAPDKMVDFARASDWTFPYLYDETQDVAKAYGAACTPDFFLFSKDGTLFYAGQFDGTRPSRGGSPDGKDLLDAARAMLAGEAPVSPQIPSSGCNIKWKPGNEPSYFG